MGARVRRKPLALVAAAWLLAGACQSDGSGQRSFPRFPVGRPTRSDSLVIALVGTLSGPEAWRGEDAFEGADMAMHVLNRRRERGESPFELVALDDAGDPARATRRIAEIADLDRAVGLIYAGPPEGIAPAENVLARAGIPAIAVHGDLYGARALTPHVFQAGPSMVWEARRLVSYFLQDRRYRSIGLAAQRGFEGDVAATAFRRAMDDRNRRPHVVRVGDGERAVGRSVRKLRRRRVEAVIVQADPATFSRVLSRLGNMGATYRTTSQARVASARRAVRRRRLRTGWWRPQIAGFDHVISTRTAARVPPGTVATETLARGVHFLPVPRFEEFAAKFGEWWDAAPLGWEQRSYDSALAIGTAARRAHPGDDIAAALEDLRDVRFAGTEITLGPDDHTLIDQTQVGIWTVPRPGVHVAGAGRRPEQLPWVPLARGFAIDGRSTDVAPEDWKHLFRRPPPPGAPPPPARRMRFAVSSPRSDPVH